MQHASGSRPVWVCLDTLVCVQVQPNLYTPVMMMHQLVEYFSQLKCLQHDLSVSQLRCCQT